jgi:hypothetical protein
MGFDLLDARCGALPHAVRIRLVLMLMSWPSARPKRPLARPLRLVDAGSASAKAKAPVLGGQVWNAVPDRAFSSPREALQFGRAASSSAWVVFIVAKMDSESVQALPQSHFRSFEPQRHHGNALSGFGHFPQLPVLLGLPYSLGVLRTADHFTTRSPHRHAGARSRASSMASRIKSRSNTNATPQQNSDSTRRGRDSFRRNNFQDPTLISADRCLLPEAWPCTALVRPLAFLGLEPLFMGGNNGRPKEKGCR